MAGRVLNRRQLREQADQAESAGAAAPAAGLAEAPAKKKARAKAPAAPRVRPARAKKAPRMRARWGVFDGGMKQVAVFDYNQRADADEKLAHLLATKKGLYFLQVVKEPMPEPVAAEPPVPGATA